MTPIVNTAVVSTWKADLITNAESLHRIKEKKDADDISIQPLFNEEIEEEVAHISI